MKTSIRNKKGFTIVELVIVIAVIAILAAVLIPTFADLVEKANQSADIQAVRQMNTQLAIANAESPITNVIDAVSALHKSNIDLKNYKPLTADHYYFFAVVNDVPMAVYTDSEYNVLYPEGTDITGLQLMSLSGAIPTDDDYTIANDGSVTITTGEQLAHLIETKRNTKDDLTITLSGNIDLKGAAVDFGETTGDITISGAGNAVLSGFRCDKNSVSPTSGEFANHDYGFGIFGKIASGTVTLRDITISGINVGNSLATHESGANTIGIIAGYIDSSATVKLSNIKFKDCVVKGYQKVGGIVGQLLGTLSMENVSFENVSVRGAVEVAKVAGIVNRNGTLTITGNNDFDGITTKALQSDIYETFTKAEVGSCVSGDENNSYGYWKDWHGASDTKNPSYLKNVVIFGVATSDLAWYYMTTGDATESISVKGTYYSLNNWTSSTSNSISKGVPQTNN